MRNHWTDNRRDDLIGFIKSLKGVSAGCILQSSWNTGLVMTAMCEVISSPYEGLFLDLWGISDAVLFRWLCSQPTEILVEKLRTSESMWQLQWEASGEGANEESE